MYLVHRELRGHRGLNLEDPNMAPGVVINSPADGAQFLATEVVDLVGVVSDANGLDDIQVVQWNSSVQGELGTAEMVQPDASGTTRVSEVLETGTHVVTLTATDIAGDSSQASVSIVVGADAPEPTVLIVKPVNFETFYEGDPIPLEGLVADPQYPTDQLEVIWYATDEASQVTSELSADYADEDGSTFSAWTNAPVGSYTITLEAINPDGYVAEDDAFIIVGDPGDIDGDNDTYSPNQGDCDDTDSTVYPGAPELPDGKDNDCDGTVDEGTELYDDDGDGYCESVTTACSDGTLPGDCNDANAQINPGMTEVCDGFDNNCDGTTDEEDATYCDTYYYDGDQDNYGSEDQFAARCLCGPSSFFTASNGDDCDDTLSNVNPAQTEIVGDEIDSNCDGQEICYIDTDDDGYVVNTLATVVSLADTRCDGVGEGTAAQVSTINDCNDSDAAINPAQVEVVGDEIDQNCDGQELCYVDADGDTYIVDTLATVSSPNTSCADFGEAAASQLQPVNDCDDTIGVGFGINPGAAEIAGDEVDQNCDGQELCYIDADDDGFVDDALGTIASLDTLCDAAGEATAAQVGADNDCDDTDDTVYPGAVEVIGDGTDQDCDGEEVCYVDSDGDGYIVDTLATVTSTDADCADIGEADASQLAALNDCDDSPTGAGINPGATEGVGDGTDQNCDGQEICYVDDDDDGYIVDTLAQVVSNDLLCDGLGEASASQLAVVNDCDDTDNAVNPNAAEIPGDAVDQDCDGEEFCYEDYDTDGYAASGTGLVSTTDIDCITIGLSQANQIVGLNDCDDTNNAINPGATETIGDQIDADCDGEEICYVDADNDGFITNALTTVVSPDPQCDAPGEASASQLNSPNDCDDTDSTISPTASEGVGDEIDQNCDGEELCYLDGDNDGYIVNTYGVIASADTDCDDPNEAASAQLASGVDCNDSDANVSPGAPEQPDNGNDDDCDGYEACYIDQDGDGYIDDSLATVTSADLDCDDPGESPYTDLDCDDNPGSGYYINPGASELPGDGVDQDCDYMELCYQDADNDNYIVDSIAVIQSMDADCDDPGEASNSQLNGIYDCDDQNASVNPGAAEVVGDEIDSDCDGQEMCYIDSDGDGFIVDTLDTTLEWRY